MSPREADSGGGSRNRSFDTPVNENTGPGAALTEDLVRPDHLMAEHKRLVTEDYRRLLGRSEDFVHRPCPACDSLSHRPKWEKDGFFYVECSDCGTVRLDPSPTAEILDEHYRTSEAYPYWVEHVFPASEPIRRELIARTRLGRLVRTCSRIGLAPDVVLEVGAGFGSFCEEAANSGRFRRVIAIEPTPVLARACRARGLEVIEQPVEQVRLPPNTVDIVAAFESIEHLLSPGEFLKTCASWLKPGGLAALTCPNVKGFDVITLGTISDVVAPAHITYFHPESIRLFLERCEFEVVELTTPGRLDADIVRKRALRGMVDLSDQPFLERILVDEWDRLGRAFQDFLADNLLSSHLWVVGRKR